jgi:hypothetical protein
MLSDISVLRPLTQEEVWKQYRELIQSRNLPGVDWKIESRMGKIDAITFARESCRLSKIDPDEDKEFFERYSSISKWIIDSERPDITHPAITNAFICGHSHKWTFRTGKANPMDDEEEGIPRGKAERYAMKWRAYAQFLCQRHTRSPYELRDVISWILHDLFICLRMFQDANSRTARLHFLEVRRGLDLPLMILRHSEAKAHRMRIAYFKQRMFIPFLRQAGRL